MSVDIQKQLDLKPYNDANIGQKQIVKTPVNAQQPVDEEKSNAAKWMVGLTASAAIVIGGLWAAKKGHLGEGAEKFAKKLLGEAVDAKPKGDNNPTEATTITSTGTTGTSGTSGKTDTSGAGIGATVAAVIPPLVVARKAISRLIKSPKNLTETIQNLQDAGVAFERNENVLSIKTGKRIQDITFIVFDDAGTSCAIVRTNKQNVVEAFGINNGSLESITRRFDGLKTQKLDEFNNPINGELRDFTKPLQQTIEFDKSKKVIQETWDVAERGVNEELTLTSVKGLKDSFYSNCMSAWKDFLSEHYDDLPPALKKAKIFQIKERVDIDGGCDTASYLTARVAKNWKKPLKEIPQEIPSEEFVRFLYKKSDPYFTDVVNALNVERNIARRVSDVKVPSEDVAEYVVLHRYNSSEIKNSAKILDGFKQFFNSDETGRKAEVFAKLFKDNLGDAKKFNEKTIISAAEAYESKFKAYELDSDIGLMEIAVKPLNECSYAEMNKILEIVNPKQAVGVIKDNISRSEETKLIIKRLSELSGLTNINGNTKIFDILKDISK